MVHRVMVHRLAARRFAAGDLTVVKLAATPSSAGELFPG
jgi:hypothetical protein